MCRILEYVAPQLMSPDNDSLFQVYIDLRPKFRIKTPPSGNDVVTVDSINTTDLANLYNYCLSNNDGIGYSNQMKNALVAPRAANSYLNRLCTAHEAFWQDRLLTIRNAGRRLLRGK